LWLLIRQSQLLNNKLYVKPPKTHNSKLGQY